MAETPVTASPAQASPTQTSKVQEDMVPTTTEQLLAMPEQAYMNDAQLSFFKNLLLDQKQQTSEHIEGIKQEIAAQPQAADELDRAQSEEDNRQRMRIAEREYYLLRKIDKALERIERKDYGYCEASGLEIGLQRLLARPTTEYSADEKARQETLERCYSKQRNG